MDSVDLKHIFDEQFAKPPSDIEAQAAVAALGDEYPAGLESYSWISRTELRRIVHEITAPAGSLVDVGCGRGGPGIWVAGMTNCSLTGVDISESALVRARDLTGRLGVVADFRLGSFEQTGLPTSVADTVMSIDAFLFTPDKQAAFVELARVLRPGGRLIMTSWDYRSQPANRPPQVADHRPLAESAGLEVLAYEETEDWHRRCVVFADFLLARTEDLAREAEVPTEKMSAGIEEMRATIDVMSRRFLLVAELPTTP